MKQVRTESWRARLRRPERRAKPARDLERMLRLGRSFLILGAIGVLVLLVTVLTYRDLTEPRMYVTPFEVSPVLVRDGYSGRVIASHLIDQLDFIRERAQSEFRAAEVTGWWERQPLDLHLLDTGLSFDTLVLRARTLLGTASTTISGELLREGNDLVLTCRATGHAGHSFAGSLDGRAVHQVSDGLLLQAAQQVYETVEPYVLAAYLYDLDDVRCAELLGRILHGPRRADVAWAHSLWGLVLLRQGRVGLALAETDLALARQPDFRLAHYTRGLVLLASSRDREAEESFREAARLDKGFFAAQYGWGRSLAAQGKLDQAIEHFSLAIELNPGDWRSYYYWGVALQRQHKPKEAIGKFQMVTLLAPHESLPYGRLAEVYAEIHEPDMERRAYEKALAMESAR